MNPLKTSDSRIALAQNDRLKESCIYKIVDVDKNRIYVGKTRNLLKRYNDHKCDLYNKRHPNIILQRIFNKGRILKMEVLEFVEKDKLLEREEYYITLLDATNRDKGYNMARNVAGGHAPKRIDVYDKDYNFIETLDSVQDAVGKYTTCRASVSQILRGAPYFGFTRQGFTFAYHGQEVRRISHKARAKTISKICQI